MVRLGCIGGRSIEGVFRTQLLLFDLLCYFSIANDTTLLITIVEVNIRNNQESTVLIGCYHLHVCFLTFRCVAQDHMRNAVGRDAVRINTDLDVSA